MLSFNQCNKEKSVQVRQSVSIDMVFQTLNQSIAERCIPIDITKDEIVISSGFLGMNKEYIPCVKMVHKNPQLKEAYWGFAVTAIEEYGCTYITMYTIGRSALAYLRNTDDGNNRYVRQSNYILQWEEECRFYNAIFDAFDSMFS